MKINKLPNQIIRINQLKPTNDLPVFKFVQKNLGTIHLETFRKEKNPNILITLLKNNADEILGKEEIHIIEENPIATGLYIETTPLLRHKGYGIGEILRLSSIMLILKNQIKNFEIFSKAEAVYFHSKYKFEPDITNFRERDLTLKNIINNCQNELIDFRIAAEKILQTASLDKNSETQRMLCKKTNLLINQYIQKVLSIKDLYKSHNFDFGFKMILKNEKILSNKSFFNNLFKKHKINYEI